MTRVEQRGAPPRAARRHGRSVVRRLASDAKAARLRSGRGAARVALDHAVLLAALLGIGPEVEIDAHEVGPRLGEDAPDDQGRRAQCEERRALRARCLLLASALRGRASGALIASEKLSCINLPAGSVAVCMGGRVIDCERCVRDLNSGLFLERGAEASRPSMTRE